MPAEQIASMREAPMWPGFEAVAHTLAYDALEGRTHAVAPEVLAPMLTEFFAC